MDASMFRELDLGWGLVRFCIGLIFLGVALGFGAAALIAWACL